MWYNTTFTKCPMFLLLLFLYIWIYSLLFARRAQMFRSHIGLMQEIEQSF